MKVIIHKDEGSILWGGVYYFGLARFPSITHWELRLLVAFAEYEKKHGREAQFVCEDAQLLQEINAAILHPQAVSSAALPERLTNCTYCLQKGCLTQLLCHTASIENAKSILACGKILSAVNARQVPGAELAKEPRNAAGDPPDYFDDVMFAWGNCQAGDRLVMERSLGRFPNDDDLGAGFAPGVRFFFTHDTIAAHPGFVFDGYHPARIHGGIALEENLLACTIPKHLESEMRAFIPENLKSRVHFIEHTSEDLLHWSKKMYDFAVSLH